MHNAPTLQFTLLLTLLTQEPVNCTSGVNQVRSGYFRFVYVIIQLL